jgi:hypothetical protein
MTDIYGLLRLSPRLAGATAKKCEKPALSGLFPYAQGAKGANAVAGISAGVAPDSVAA